MFPFSKTDRAIGVAKWAKSRRRLPFFRLFRLFRKPRMCGHVSQGYLFSFSFVFSPVLRFVSVATCSYEINEIDERRVAVVGFMAGRTRHSTIHSFVSFVSLLRRLRRPRPLRPLGAWPWPPRRQPADRPSPARHCARALGRPARSTPPRSAPDLGFG